MKAVAVTSVSQTAPLPVDSTAPNSVLLRQRTAAAHESAEGTDFISRLMGGELSADAFADFTGQLWFIYSALESAMRNGREHAAVAAVYDQRLERKEKLEKDLTSLFGEDWKEKISQLESTAEYVARIQELEKAGNGPELVAHHYVRYLGDLAGGQVIARRVAEHYNVAPEALTFYDFAELGKVKPFRDQYRDTLDSLPLNEEEQEQMLSEAVRAFSYNQAVFEGLAARH